MNDSNVIDRSGAIAKVEQLPTLLRTLNVFGQVETVNSDAVQFDVQNDGNIYVLEDHLEGVMDKNHTEQDSYNIHTVPLNHYGISHTLTKRQLAGVKAFGSDASEEQLAQAIVAELTKQSNHLDITKEYMFAQALIKNEVVSNVHGSLNYSTEFGISRPTEALDATAPGSLLAGLRSSMKKARQGINGRGMANGYTVLLSESMWDAVVNSDDLKQSYEYGQAFPNGNPLLLNTPELAGHSMFRWGNVDFILWDTVFPTRTAGTDAVMVDGEGIMFPKVTGGSLGRFFAGPSSQIDWQSQAVRERYAYQFMGEKGRHIDIESEASWQCLITMPGAVVDLSLAE